MPGFAGAASVARTVTAVSLAIARAGFTRLACATGLETGLELEIAGCEMEFCPAFTSTDGVGAAGIELVASLAIGRPRK